MEAYIINPGDIISAIIHIHISITIDHIMTAETEKHNNNEMPGLKRMESDHSHHGAAQLAPLPTQEIARRKTVEAESQYP